MAQKGPQLDKKKTGLQAAATDDICRTDDSVGTLFAGAGDVACDVDVPPARQPEPKTRDDFLRYSRDITLDPNTAHQLLLLSEGNRKVTNMGEPQPYSSHPDRFTDSIQVLSAESLTGCCYWEVEWGGKGVSVAVAYKKVISTGKESILGINDKYLALKWGLIGYSFCNNNDETPVSGPQSSRIGVYLDHSAGVLSFYSVSETMTLLHRVQTKFTQPLYAGVDLSYPGNTAEFCKLK